MIEQALRFHGQAKRQLENRYINNKVQFEGIKRSNSGGKIYYLFDRLESKGIHIDWYEKDVERFDDYWKKGWSIEKMAFHFNRKPDEVLLLIVERSILNKIKERKNGYRGWVDLGPIVNAYNCENIECENLFFVEDGADVKCCPSCESIHFEYSHDVELPIQK